MKFWNTVLFYVYFLYVPRICRQISSNISIDHTIFTHTFSIIIPTITCSWNVLKCCKINTLSKYIPNSTRRAQNSRIHCKEKFFFPKSQMGLADHVNHSYARTLSDVSFISVTPRLQSSPIEIAFGQVSLFLFNQALLLSPSIL